MFQFCTLRKIISSRKKSAITLETNKNHVKETPQTLERSFGHLVENCFFQRFYNGSRNVFVNADRVN